VLAVVVVVVFPQAARVATEPQAATTVPGEEEVGRL
jgi:hypothetical protein